MSTAEQPEFPWTPGGGAVAAPKSEAELRAQVREAILNLIAAENQPSAGELLTLLEEQFGWWTRTVFMPIVQALRSDLAVREYLREYLKITLTDEELAEALRGGAKPEREFTSSIDELLQTSALLSGAAQNWKRCWSKTGPGFRGSNGRGRWAMRRQAVRAGEG